MSSFIFISTIILSYALCTSSSPLDGEDWSLGEMSRIMGGHAAGDGQFLYQVSLQLTSECTQNGHICSAALVGPRHFVTAASCVTDKLGNSTWTAMRATQFRAHLTAIDLNDENSIMYVKLITVHPKYDPDTHLHDLAVLQMTEDVSEFGIPLDLASLGESSPTCNVTGWGISAATDDSYSNMLRWAEVNTKMGTQCAGVAFDVTSEMLCSGDATVDLCAGDRGAPLVCSGVLRGIATHVGCGAGSVFTDLLSEDHRAFVQDLLKSDAVRAKTTIVLGLATVLVTLCHSAY